VADHRVEGVDGAVRDKARDARDRAPDERADDGVGGVLGDGFDGRAGQFRRVQTAGVAAGQCR
jgi:hypothetical protein